MKETTKYSIIKWLDGKDFTYEGPICRAVHDITLSKESIISRRLREMADEDWCMKHTGKPAPLEKTRRQINGKGQAFVMYKIRLPDNLKDLEKHYDSIGRTKVIFVEVDGVRKAKKVLI